ncbi:MAG: amidohydrolase family protein [Nitrososphaerota archaeon]|nr:amidohydrolase family protein [Nitrososphaerota archaeon]
MIVDFQHHFTPNLKEPPRPRAIYANGIPISTERPGLGRLEPHVKFMDKVGIDVSVLTSPRGMRGDVQLAADANEGLVKACREFPDRFRFLVHVAPFDSGSVREAKGWLSQCPGAVLPSAFGEVGLDDQRLEGLYSLLEDEGKYLFIHAPVNATEGEAKAYNAYDLFRTVGREFSLVTALMRLVLGGVLDGHPKLKIVLSHFGGEVAPLVERIEHYQDKSEWGLSEDPVHGKTSARPFRHYLGRVYFDTAGFYGNVGALKAALLEIPKRRIVFGTDYPQEIREPEPAMRMLSALRRIGAAQNGSELLR